ncbi:division/cell wall cluster transcriptional repressor MraZ [Brevundimonas vesicularis]|uniref:division/cell wall cluster transcriptional repressor MraZ n=1 Tax=Brevundimonas vesicularis TaxID=41276 RepID=UPI0038D3FA7B
MFLSTYEKQLDGKRRLLIPQEYRTAENGAEHGVFCFPSIEADCLEAGGDKLFAEYRAVIESLPFGDPYRSALESSIYGEQKSLSYDAAGRITLPDYLCAEFDLKDAVMICGVGERFQIWNKDKWAAHRAEKRLAARAGLEKFGEIRRQSMLDRQGGAG